MTIAAHIVGGTGDTSHMTREQRLSITPEEAALRQKGTKWFMVGWYTYIGLIWTLKLNMLVLYRRIVSVAWVNKFIVPTMGLVGVTGVSIWILFTTACHPFKKLWQIYPDPGSEFPIKYILREALKNNRLLHAAKPSISDHRSRSEPCHGHVHNSDSNSHYTSSKDFDATQNRHHALVLRRHLHDDGCHSSCVLRSCGR
jgi:hypothetical protein